MGDEPLSQIMETAHRLNVKEDVFSQGPEDTRSEFKNRSAIW